MTDKGSLFEEISTKKIWNYLKTTKNKHLDNLLEFRTLTSYRDTNDTTEHTPSLTVTIIYTQPV